MSMSSTISVPGDESAPPTPSTDYHTSHRRSPARGRMGREALVILLGALLYFFVRGLMQSEASRAMAHAEVLIALEQHLRLFHESWLQDQIIDHDWLVTLFNRIYIFGHWPVIVGTMSWLIWKHTEQFSLYRTALLISGAIGLVCFVLLPMAPPRLVTDQSF